MFEWKKNNRTERSGRKRNYVIVELLAFGGCFTACRFQIWPTSQRAVAYQQAELKQNTEEEGKKKSVMSAVIHVLHR
jgi:hypothetical protein